MLVTRAHQLAAKWKVALLGALVALLVVSWGEFAANIVGPALQRPSWPAPASWVAARLAWEGHPELIYAERSVFYQESARLGAGRDYFEANVPTTLLPYLPLAPLRIDQARNIWLVFSLVCFFAAWLSLLKSLKLTLPWILALSALVTQFAPLRDDIGRGQAYTVLSALSVVGALLMVRRGGQELSQVASKGSRLAQLAAGVAFGFVGILKLYYGAVLLLPALVRRQSALLLMALGVFGAGVLLTIVWWGTGPWATAIPFSLTFHERAVSGLDIYQSFNGLLTHLLRYDADLNPTPVADIPSLIGPLWWVLAVATSGVALYAIWRGDQQGRARAMFPGPSARDLLASALATSLALLLAPVCDEYHFVLIIFPLLLVGVVLWERLSLARASVTAWQSVRRSAFIPHAVFGVAALLLGAPWPYRAPTLPGWYALLHYPRLYGNLLLFGLIVALLLRSPVDQVITQ